MKNKSMGKCRKIMPAFLLIFIVGGLLVNSCNPESNDLGVGIFPSTDTIEVYTDTITDFDLYLIERPFVTSVTSANNDTRSYLLGSRRDTISGLSKADFATELANNYAKTFGENPLLDSILFSMYFAEVEGDTSQEMRVMVYELTESLSAYENYSSDFDISGMYDAEPLVDEVIIPKPGGVYEFLIEDEDFRTKIWESIADNDTTFIDYTSHKDKFKGIYVTTETVDEGGSIARVSLGSTYTGLSFKYVHDSLNTDTTDEYDYRYHWFDFRNTAYTTSLSFEDYKEYMCQKVNMFQHDYSGTYVSTLIDDQTANAPIAYIQGMGGLNAKIRINNFDRYFDDGVVAINAANLVFEPVSDSLLSGISPDDIFDRLMMMNQISQDSLVNVYDFAMVDDTHYFGQINQSITTSAFYDPVYFYNFHLGRHMQGIYDGDDITAEFVLYPYNATTSSKLTKIWTNYANHSGGMKLEIIYSKF